jgi:hypothetical protein
MSAVNVSLSPESLRQISHLSWPEFLSSIKPLLFLVVGMTLYALFIFKFYRFLAKRDILQLKTEEFYKTYEGLSEKLVRIGFYVLENLILIPIIVFFWFVILALFLLVMAKNMDIAAVLLGAAAFVAAVRIISYYDEGLAQDLAKLVPLTLLAVFLTEFSIFSMADLIDAVKEIPFMFRYLVYYMLIVAPLEFALRITHGISMYVLRKEINNDP